MPIILRCQCGKETPHVYPANEGWTIEPQIGGTEVLCPNCQQKRAAATITNNENLTRLFNLSNKQPADFAECGARLFFFFREEQRKHGHKECLCTECEGDMVSALKKLLAPDNAVNNAQEEHIMDDVVAKFGRSQHHHSPRSDE